MKLTKKILQREKLVAELCKKNNWNSNYLTPYQMQIIAQEIQKAFSVDLVKRRYVDDGR